ncbi:MAG: hypothetical protein V1729_02725 [Candidatus Woesearchaeota archaeon]
MPKSLRHRLLEKGWTEEEIEGTLDILYSEEKIEKHSHFAKASHPIIYWIGLIVAIIGNLILSVTLIPFLMILNEGHLYIILGIVGGVFGALFNVILKDIEQVDESHHVVAGVFIPAIAVVTVYFMVGVANKFNTLIQSENIHSELVLSIVYVVCFSAPYFIYKIKDFVWEHKQKGGGLPPSRLPARPPEEQQAEQQQVQQYAQYPPPQYAPPGSL